MTTEPTTKEESVEQHMKALERANVVRLERAELKREVKRGEQSVSDVIDPRKSIPECAVSMTIAELLEAQLRWGSKRMRRFLATTDIRESRAVGNLTARERQMLSEALAPSTEGIAA